MIGDNLHFSDLEKEITDINNTFLERFHKQQFHKMENLYTEDCEVLPPNSPMITGRQGIDDDII